MIRVLVVDDQELVRAGLRGLLRTEFGFDVVGECADGSEVIAAVESLTPHVVLMDVRMPLVDGVRATRELRRRDDSPPVLALTTFDDDEVLAGMLRAGASGFVLKWHLPSRQSVAMPYRRPGELVRGDPEVLDIAPVRSCRGEMHWAVRAPRVALIGGDAPRPVGALRTERSHGLDERRVLIVPPVHGHVLGQLGRQSCEAAG